jgi:hypothetical protein
MNFLCRVAAGGARATKELQTQQKLFLFSRRSLSFSKGGSTVFKADGTAKEFKPIDIQAELDKIHKKTQKNHMNVQTDGPMGVGKISQDALKEFRPKITTSALKGVVFDLATILNVKPSDPDAALEDKIVSDDIWNIGEGAREFLMYLESRGLKVALLPRLLIDRQKLIDGTIDVFEERMNYNFRYHAANAAQLKQVETNLQDISTKMNLETKDIMCVSMSEHVIRSAKDVNMYTCAFNLGGKNWKTKQQALYNVNKIGEMKSHVEELNGITFRD